MPAAPMSPASLPLRDIHLPPAISWWPPAPGWWLLLLALLLLCALTCLLWQRRQRRRLRRLALTQLQLLQERYQQQKEPKELLQGLSRLLRQATLLHFPQQGCAGLVGEEWLQFLDQQLGGKEFSTGIGQLLAAGPYRQQAGEFDAAGLLALCDRWLRKLPPAPKKQRRSR